MSKALGQSLDALILGKDWPLEATTPTNDLSAQNPEEQSLLLSYRCMGMRQRRVMLDLVILLDQQTD